MTVGGWLARALDYLVIACGALLALWWFLVGLAEALR